MKIVGISGSNVGSKTRTVMDLTIEKAREKYPYGVASGKCGFTTLRKFSY